MLHAVSRRHEVSQSVFAQTSCFKPGNTPFLQAYYFHNVTGLSLKPAILLPGRGGVQIGLLVQIGLKYPAGGDLPNTDWRMTLSQQRRQL